MNVTLIAYLLTAVAFGLLGVLLRPAPRDLRAPEVRLGVAAFGMSAWAAILAFGPSLSGEAFLCVEAAHLAVWFWLLSSIARRQKQPRLLTAALSWLVPVTTVAALVYGRWMVPSGAFDFRVAVIPQVGLLAAVLGLIAIEQVHRNAEGTALSPVRWLCLGIGLIFAYDLFFYAQSMLLHRLDPVVFALRGFVFAALVPLIALASRRMPDWSLGLFVSRQVVFYSTSIVLVGVYLLLMSAGGVLVRATGGAWGPELELAFLAAALLLLIPLVFAGAVRRRLQVFISKHFYSSKYDHREEWLRFVRTIAARRGDETVAQTAIRSVAQILESPAGALWTFDESSNTFVHVDGWRADARPGESLPSLPAGEPMIAFLRRTGWLVDLAEHASNPSIYDNFPVPAVAAALDPEAIVVPLLNGEALDGVLALTRPAGLGKLTFEDRDLLKTIGRHIAAHLAQHDRDRRLSQGRQFEAYHRFSAFVMHDLKNMAAQLQLVVQNAARHKRNPAFVDDAMSTIANSVERMQRLLAQLGQGDQRGAEKEIELAEVAERAVLRTAARQPVPRLIVSGRPRVTADVERLASVIENVVRNAQDATDEDGDVVVEVTTREGRPIILVCDTGDGMDAEFIRERLFRPFDTTKGSRGMGIGAYQAREYLRALGGDVAVESKPGQGTSFQLIFAAVRADLSREATLA